MDIECVRRPNQMHYAIMWTPYPVGAFEKREVFGNFILLKASLSSFSSDWCDEIYMTKLHMSVANMTSIAE